MTKHSYKRIEGNREKFLKIKDDKITDQKSWDLFNKARKAALITWYDIFSNHFNKPGERDELLLYFRMAGEEAMYLHHQLELLKLYPDIFDDSEKNLIFQNHFENVKRILISVKKGSNWLASTDYDFIHILFAVGESVRHGNFDLMNYYLDAAKADKGLGSVFDIFSELFEQNDSEKAINLLENGNPHKATIKYIIEYILHQNDDIALNYKLKLLNSPEMIFNKYYEHRSKCYLDKSDNKISYYLFIVASLLFHNNKDTLPIIQKCLERDDFIWKYLPLSMMYYKKQAIDTKLLDSIVDKYHSLYVAEGKAYSKCQYMCLFNIIAACIHNPEYKEKLFELDIGETEPQYLFETVRFTIMEELLGCIYWPPFNCFGVDENNLPSVL